MRFEVYRDVAGAYRWRLIASNGRNVASSGESFSSQSNATAAAQNFKAKAKAWAYEIYADAGRPVSVAGEVLQRSDGGVVGGVVRQQEQRAARRRQRAQHRGISNGTVVANRQWAVAAAPVP